MRIIDLRSTDVRTVLAKFTARLNPRINRNNIRVESQSVGVPNAEVLDVKIAENIIRVTTRPMTPNAHYIIKFISTDIIPFTDVNGTDHLFEDDRTNFIQILGAEEPGNPIRDEMILALHEHGIYNLERGTFVRTILNQLATNFAKALYAIRQSKNENYLSITITDERKIRGRGPFDRLNEEGAYEIIRVGKTETNATLNTSFSFDNFPSDPITLQRIQVANEELLAGTEGISGTFDNLILTLKNKPITKVNEIKIIYEDNSEFIYNIRSLGYQIRDSRYDTLFASTFLLLEDNQIKLNDILLDDEDFIIPGASDKIIISYEYKGLGVVVEEGSIRVSQILDAIREPVPALTNEFSLKRAPIVNENDNVFEFGGVQFLDPISETPFQTIHPAFKKEIPFRFEGLPRRPGEYSVDYNTGRVFVFGATDQQEGTGSFPPAATYKYRKTFVPGLDFIYNPQTHEIVASPIRDLANQEAKISFSFEKTLVPGIDYEEHIHKEAIDERIENRLLSSGSLRVLNTPITNAFKVFNETSGEIYNIQRFNDDTVFFTSNIPPLILNINRERASFKQILNETLFVNNVFTNSQNIKVFKIKLLNNIIINTTEDAIGASFNTSVAFSRPDIFIQEVFYNSEFNFNTNINKLSEGQYQVDYTNGIVYVGVEDNQSLNIGTILYKTGIIVTNNSHIMSISNIYHSINQSLGPSKTLDYVRFSDSEIIPLAFDVSDERFTSGDTTLPYVIENNQIKVTDNIKTVRHLFDLIDLDQNEEATDFSQDITFVGNIITLGSTGVEKTGTFIVDGAQSITIDTGSAGISLNSVISAVRESDNAQLADGYEDIVNNVITFPSSSPGDVLTVIYTVILNTNAAPVVDYDRGGFYVDYTHLADEILVSYEFGDNSIGFRETDSINEGEDYFVTYKAGALRDALLPNFGSLIDIPELNAFDTDFDREKYRDALIGALQSFTKGPTIPAMSRIVESVTKINPEIIEAIFDFWSLGNSHLHPGHMIINGSPELVSGKFDQGYLFNKIGDSVVFPVSSNLRIEEGSLEMWVKPQWDGLDNDAILTFSELKRDGLEILTSNIFIGAESTNPENSIFSIKKEDAIGLPSKIFTDIGLFIYFDPDENRWKFLAKDTPDGYEYSGLIQSSGEVYDVKFIQDLGEVTDVLRSGISKIEFALHIDSHDAADPDGYAFNDGYVPGFSFDGFSFMADDQHYLFDLGEDIDKNRISLFKDGRGYLNFRVFDNGKLRKTNEYKVSADISDWQAGQLHHVGVSWKLNTVERRDEIHLFIDGFEVPNIIKYGGRPAATSTDRFRTVKPEIVAGTVPLNTVTSNDLTTIQGSEFVTSENINFEDFDILPGHTIEILETGFGTFSIVGVVENTLELDTPMPASLSDARFSVNPFSVIVESPIDIVKNIIVSKFDGYVEEELPGVRAEVPSYSISKNILNENVLTILGSANAGDQILIRTLGLNHRRCRERVFIWGNDDAVLKTFLPPPINLDEVLIKKVILPLLAIGPENSTVVGSEFQAVITSVSQPSEQTEGRRLAVRITGGNVDFGTPTEVTINGEDEGGATTDVLTFNEPGIQLTKKFTVITNIEVNTTPNNLAKDGIAIEVKEAFSITVPDGNDNFPVVRFAVQRQNGSDLEGSGASDIVSDQEGFFSIFEEGNVIVIDSPVEAAGTYTIVEVIDNKTIRLDQVIADAFTDGVYTIYNISIGRSGFQNGFFFLQKAGTANEPFALTEGYYEFDYAAYLEVPFDPVTQTAHIGNSFNSDKPANAVIDEFRVLSRQLTDTRVGETIALNEESFTTSFQSINAFRRSIETLMLLHFDHPILINDSDYHTLSVKEFVQSGSSVNEHFGHSIVIRDRGLTFNNNGILTNKEGTIEFWVSPLFDTNNDPNDRVYFDATSSVVEEKLSISRGSVMTDGRISRVLSVRLATDHTNTGINYFIGGSISDDFRTIQLGTALPFQQTPVKISYIPSGLQGDRITILKDSEGFITFNVRASGQDFQVRQPVFWKRNTWHRVKATYKFNRQDNKDEIRLWVDSEERGVIVFGENLIFGDGAVFGQTKAGVTDQILITDIDFTDQTTQFFIGTTFEHTNGAQARIDNFKISNIARGPVVVSGQPLDTNFSSNTSMVFPVIEDAATTFLLDFDKLIEKSSDFAILRDSVFGIFNFTLNIIDSFRIISDDEKIKAVLNKMILALKPANSKVQINTII